MVLLFFLCIVWGVGQVAVKVSNAGIPPLLGAGIRSSGAALCIWAWARLTGVRLVPREPRWGYGVAIALLFAGEFVFIFRAFLYTNVARATLFLYMAPFVVTIGAHYLLPDEPLRGGKLVGLVSALAGLAIAFAHGLALPNRGELVGDAMAFVAALMWGATTLVVKARGAGLSAATTLFYQLAGSAIVLLALAALTGEFTIERATPLVIGAIVYQTVVVAFASYLAWFRLLERYHASSLSAFSFWTPIFGVVAGGVLLGEPITPTIAIAVLFVAAGIYLVNRPEPVNRDAPSHSTTA
jgi:drug/metabolite transporter (DMT)-like permease